MVVVPKFLASNIVPYCHHQGFPLHLRQQIIQTNAKRKAIIMVIERLHVVRSDFASRLPGIKGEPNRNDLDKGNVTDTNVPQDGRPIRVEIKILKRNIDIGARV